MHNNLNTLEMKQVLELQPFIPNANWLNIWQLNNLRHRLKGNPFPQPTPNCGSSCEKVLFCLFVLEFYGPVNNEDVSSRSVNSGTVPGQA